MCLKFRFREFLSSRTVVSALVDGVLLVILDEDSQLWHMLIF
jgi:hypothetical protein